VRVVIAGSRSLPPGQAPRLLGHFLGALPEDAVILLRHPVTGQPSAFEMDVARLAGSFHLEVDHRMPEPTEETPGRSSVYLRDYAMVEGADLVLLFIAAGDLELGVSGTFHLLEAALQADRPVYVYAIAPDGKAKRWGEYDPEHLFADIAPSA
jgi:hypothetical protein